MPTKITPPEVPAPFEPYELTVDGEVYTVLENQQPDCYRVRFPDGQVYGLMVASNAATLTPAKLAALLP
jgi:hypothetical protein